MGDRSMPALRTVSRAYARTFGVAPARDDAAGLARGDVFLCDVSNARGRFVGVSPQGVLWAAFPGQDFDEMARRFDAKWPEVSRG